MSVELIWEELGKISFTEHGRPQLAHIPKAPGVYRIISDDGWCYVGQAKDLHHRIYEYHRPTLDNEHEHRIHRLMRKHRCKLQIIVDESLIARILLIQIGYKGEYQRTTAKWMDAKTTDWVTSETPPIELGYGRGSD